MKTKVHKLRWAPLAAGLLMSVLPARSQDNGKKPSSYAPVDIHESFSTIQSRMTAAKPEIMKRHMALLEQRGKGQVRVQLGAVKLSSSQHD